VGEKTLLKDPPPATPTTEPDDLVIEPYDSGLDLLNPPDDHACGVRDGDG
jgi:hypothetical protein